MHLLERKKMIRVLFILSAMILAVFMTGIALADGPTGPVRPPGGPMGGPPPMGMPAKPMGSCIKGQVIYDGNHNGELDNREHPMDGAVVYLSTRLHSMTIGKDIARDGGMYAFCGLPPGQYILKVEPPESHVKDELVLTKGYNPTLPIVVEMGKDRYVSFGFGLPRVYDPNAMLNQYERTSGQTGVDG